MDRRSIRLSAIVDAVNPYSTWLVEVKEHAPLSNAQSI